MKAEEFEAKLKLYCAIAGSSQNSLAKKAGFASSTFTRATQGHGLERKDYNDIAEAMNIEEADFVAGIAQFEAALYDAFKLGWRRLLSKKDPPILGKDDLALRRTPEALQGSRLVRVKDEADEPDAERIRIGTEYRLWIDLMFVLKESNIEIEDDTAPIGSYHIYVLQVESDQCMLLRPNPYLNPKSLPDWFDPRDNKKPAWKLLIPPPKEKPEGMVFEGEPGPGELFVLLRNRPLSDNLIVKLTDKLGAGRKALDDLARELTLERGDDPEMRNYWRLFRRPYRLVR